MAEGEPTGLLPASDIYTVLVIIATAFLVTGVAFVSVRAQVLFGSWLPF